MSDEAVLNDSRVFMLSPYGLCHIPVESIVLKLRVDRSKGKYDFVLFIDDELIGCTDLRRYNLRTDFDGFVGTIYDILNKCDPKSDSPFTRSIMAVHEKYRCVDYAKEK